MQNSPLHHAERVLREGGKPAHAALDFLSYDFAAFTNRERRERRYSADARTY
jgi:hypothetical protein